MVRNERLGGGVARLPQRPVSERERVVLPIPGMHCASCVSKIEGALSGLDGVYSAAVHLPSKTASVEFDSSRVSAQAIRRAVEERGYPVAGLAASYEDAEKAALEAERKRLRTLKMRLITAAALWAAILSHGFFNFSIYTVWALATVAQLFCGSHFHQGLMQSLRHRRADMDTLVSVGTWAAYAFGSWAVFLPEKLPPGSRMPDFDASVGLITVVTLGRVLEISFKKRSSDALRRLLRKAPKTARVLRPAGEAVVPLSEVAKGERILVRPGEQVGLDGVVEEGFSAVDESLLTGESIPAEKGPGARVYGGTLNMTGAMTVAVTEVGATTALSRILEAVQRSQSSKAPVQRLVDRVAAVFVPAVFLLALGAAVFWLSRGKEPRLRNAMTAFVSVLAVACPCALGLATPMAVMIGMAKASESGVLLRNAETLEKVGKLDAVVFDKTGTLTEGRPELTALAPAAGKSEAELLRYAVTAEQRSEHPFAEAIRRAAAARNISPAALDSFEAFPGRGVKAAAFGETILSGNAAWLSASGVRIPQAALALSGAGSVVAVAVDGAFYGTLQLADRVRDGAEEVVARLKAIGLDLILASGDRRAAAEAVASKVGISTVYAELLPDEKSKIVAELQAKGHRVAMVGEGFNDAPALSQADIGIALGSGTDVAMESADITLLSHDLAHVMEAIELSRRIRRVIRQNLAWAFAYNILLLPVAAGALAPQFGLWLRPQFAGAAMALSSISVIVNSLRLRRKHAA